MSRERVLAAAVEVADAEGVHAVSMRRIAERLQVEAMSLYHHVESKEAIVNGIVDLVFSEIELPSSDVEWRSAMRRRALSAHAAIARHPWVLALVESLRDPGPAILHHHDAVLGCLRRAGFSVASAGLAFTVIDSYVYGFVLQELNLPIDVDTDLGDVAAQLELEADGRYPNLIDMLRESAEHPPGATTDAFASGLELILDAVAHLRET